MSRTRKRTPREFYNGTKIYQPCPRHGYCSWCDEDRQHNELKTSAAAVYDLTEGVYEYEDDREECE